MTDIHPPQQPFDVVEVTGKSGQRDFLTLPNRLYAGDPAWVPPLFLEQQQRIFANAPLTAHSQIKAWVAYRCGGACGRITAQLDKLQPKLEGHTLGYFGMLEAEDDPELFAQLLQTAEHWLRSQGAQAVRGPYNLSINEEVGLLVENFQDPPFFMMGHAPSYYAQRLEQQGYSGIKNLLTYIIPPDFEAPEIMTRLAQRARRSVSVRPLRRRGQAAEFATLRSIFNDAWSDNWGFVPFTPEEFAEMGQLLSLLVDRNYVQIAEVDGEAVAFIVALPNINETIGDLGGRLFPLGWLKLLWRLKVKTPGSARVALMGVRKAYQHSRLGPALAFMVIDAVRKALSQNGVETVEMGWILEDNSGMRHIIEAIGGKIYKRYRIYQKSLLPENTASHS